MDKITSYQTAILEFLHEQAAIPYTNAPKLRNTVVTDIHNREYLLICIGWNQASYCDHIIIHFSISENGKVWINQNNTEIQIGDELIEKGVAREDIILGFLPEYARPFAGFAVG